PGAVWEGANQRNWQLRMVARTRGLTEVGADRALRDEALRMLRERPGDFAAASLARLGRFWGVAPSPSVYGSAIRWAVVLWTVPLWLALAWSLARRGTWSWPIVVAPLILAALTAVHAFYWTDLRMRAPAVPAIALLAASVGFGGGETGISRILRGFAIS